MKTIKSRSRKDEVTALLQLRYRMLQQFKEKREAKLYFPERTCIEREVDTTYRERNLYSNRIQQTLKVERKLSSVQCINCFCCDRAFELLL